MPQHDSHDSYAIAPAAPLPQVLRDLVLGPLDPGTSKFRIRFRADPPGLALPHLRAERGRLFDVTEVTPFSPAEPGPDLPRLAGPVLYGGPYIRHFAHFAAECVHRLYARRLWPDLARAPVLFQAEGHKPLKIEPWLAPVLDLCGVALEEVIFLRAPTRIEALHVPLPGRIMVGPDLFAGYADLFPLVPMEPRPDDPQVLYLGRSQHLHSGGYAGEALVEEVLAAAGITVIHAEAHPVAEVARLLRHASHVVFAEGGAIQNLHFCGRTRARMLLVGRRAGTFERFRHVIEAVADTPELFEDYRTLGALEWDVARARPAATRAVVHMNIAGLLDRIARFTGRSLACPAPEVIAARVAQDLRACLADPRATRPRTTTPEQRAALEAALRANAAAAGVPL